MSVAELRRSCRRDIARSMQYSDLLPSLCRLTIQTNYIPVGVGMLAGIFTLNPALFMLSLGAYKLFKSFDESPLLAPLPSGRFNVLPDITNDLEPCDRVFLNKLMTRAGRNPKEMRVLSNFGSLASTPSVSREDGIDYVILPPEFFTVWQMNPRVAEAMLAHEVGHFLQHDADMYFEFSRYMRFMLSRYLPALLILSVVACASAVLLVPAVKSGAEHSMFLAISDAATWRSYEGAFRTAMGVVWSAYAFTLCLLITTMFVCVLVLIYRILNFRSEAVCDRISLALTENSGIQDALSLFGAMDEKRFFTPSLAWRRTKLSKVSSLIRLPRSSEDGTEIANIFKPMPDDFVTRPQNRIWLLARLGLWVTAGLVFALWTSDYLRAHPFGWSEPDFRSEMWPPEGNYWPSMSGDGSAVAFYDRWSQRIQIDDVRTRTVRAAFSPRTSPYRARLWLNYSGSLLAVLPSYGTGALYDVLGQTYLGELPEQHFSTIEFVRIASQELLLSISRSGSITLWQIFIEDGKVRFEAMKKFQMAGEFAALSVRADGTEFATVSNLTKDIDSPDYAIEVWNVNQGMRMRFRSDRRGIDKISLSSDGQWVSFNAIGRVIVAKLGPTVETQNLYDSGLWMAVGGVVSFSPTSNLLVSDYDVTSLDGYLGLYGPPPAAGEPSPEWPKKRLSVDVQRPFGFDDVRWSSDGRVLSAATRHGSITLLSMPQGALINSFVPDRAQSLVVSSSLHYAATLHPDGVLRLWNIPEKAIEIKSLVREYRFSRIKCAGALENDGILVRHENGASRIAPPDGEPEAIVDPGKCSAISNPRYTFNSKSFVDSGTHWSIPLQEPLVDATVLTGPEPDDFWHPDYRILHRSGDGDGIELRTISSATSKNTMVVQAALFAGFFIMLVEAGFSLLRRFA